MNDTTGDRWLEMAARMCDVLEELNRGEPPPEKAVLIRLVAAAIAGRLAGMASGGPAEARKAVRWTWVA